MVNRMIIFGSVIVRGQPVDVMVKPVTQGYFAAVGSTFTAGRAFRADENAGIVVNETLARRCWPDHSAVGEPVGHESTRYVVGVVRDAFDYALDRPSQPTVYSLLLNPGGCTGNCNNVNYVVRTQSSLSEVATAIRLAVNGVNRDSVVLELNGLDERLAGSIKDRSFALLVLGLFAVAGIAICCAGVAGIVAFLVRRRTRKIAIASLGATEARALNRFERGSGGNGCRGRGRTSYRTLGIKDTRTPAVRRPSRGLAYCGLGGRCNADDCVGRSPLAGNTCA